MEQDQFNKIKEIADQERRETLSNEEGVKRKIRTLEEEKKRLDQRHRQEQSKGKNYENALGQIKNEIQE